jgi:hypothetical protein
MKKSQDSTERNHHRWMVSVEHFIRFSGAYLYSRVQYPVFHKRGPQVNADFLVRSLLADTELSEDAVKDIRT